MSSKNPQDPTMKKANFIGILDIAGLTRSLFFVMIFVI